MSSIGPQLPPHLAKRKRTPDDESPESPRAKQRDTDRNQDEINLDSDDEDDYGPSAPTTAPAPLPPARGPIGPSLPPSNTDEIDLEDSDDDTIGPSAPPPPKSKPSIGPTLPPTNRDEIPLEETDSSEDEAGPAPPTAPKPIPAPTRRVQGPAPPPAPLSERPPSPASSSDSDSDYGPALPTSTSHQARQTAALAASTARAAEEAAKPQRDEWMLALPTSSGYRAPDPTKLKNRRFNSGPRTNTSTSNSSSGEIASIWTETPEQKRKRLENAVLGRDSGPQAATTTGSSTNQSKKADLDSEQAARIRHFTEATRGKSLYEEHQASRKGRELGAEEEEDDPSKRAFDREKDIRSGGRISATQRREFMNRAADFGGRFAKGKFL
ncbi:uncharacterized protein GGS22DRAFT_172634 [Annulohypoxylon maeteangense]|uniref:uncharacterized protein n=1 Tax=Annulohypoxylon maeteangense TaxID=1927788 RepID=UPI002007C861|nr:uncharacterized protein GGS22DRAFT_172634 [Annulohypoxylon maeteangense]KAI0881194.1 hypothetical protein GGS22DRAFT_172634 [Annulohypoxylon maeteangense]